MFNKKRRKATDRPLDLEVERLERVIGALPTIPPRARTDTKRYLIERLREPLRQAMTQRGYSFAGLAAILTQAGLTVHASTLRQYLGPINPRRVAPRSDQPPTDQPSTDQPPMGEPSPARAVRGAGSSPRPGAGAVGSPEALARLESALAGAPAGPPPAEAAAPAARPRPADPPYCPPGTFIPRPELPLEEWYKPSERTP